MERLSLERLPARSSGHRYWATAIEASEMLGVSRERVHQLVAKGHLPAVRHAGRWWFRRDPLEVVTNARDARKLVGEWG